MELEREIDLIRRRMAHREAAQERDAALLAEILQEATDRLESAGTAEG